MIHKVFRGIQKPRGKTDLLKKKCDKTNNQRTAKHYYFNHFALIRI